MYLNCINISQKSYEVVKLLFIQLPSIIYNNDEVKITKILNERMQLRNHGCYVPVIDYMGKKCFDYSVIIYKNCLTVDIFMKHFMII